MSWSYSLGLSVLSLGDLGGPGIGLGGFGLGIVDLGLGGLGLGIVDLGLGGHENVMRTS